MEENKKIVTRFAPSPTGFLHLGAYRTAIFAYLFAKKHYGEFILRIEDTDKERSKKEYEEDILSSLKWMDLNYDRFYRQSENIETHKKYLNKMIDEGNAYISSEEAKDGSGVIKEIIRFKNPNLDVTFDDMIKGKVTMNTEDLGDFVIAKNINEPLFHLAVVVDDFEEGVTHVIRGEDHVSNTPRQILIQRAIGAPTPIYAHLPLVLGPDKLKLSKRRGAKSLTEYEKLGFLPSAILNGVTFVGWNPGTEKEIFSHDELIEEFDLSKVQKSPAVFNEQKLEWFNKEHMKILPDKDFNLLALNYLKANLNTITLSNLNNKLLEDYIQRYKVNISKLADYLKFIEDDSIALYSDVQTSTVHDINDNFSLETSNTSRDISFNNHSVVFNNDYFLNDPIWTNELIKSLSLSIEDNDKNNIVKNLTNIKDIIEKSHNIKDLILNDKINNPILIYGQNHGMKETIDPFRKILSGKNNSRNIFEIIEKIGKERAIKRIENFLNYKKNDVEESLEIEINVPKDNIVPVNIQN